jgi:hypothetical protein
MANSLDSEDGVFDGIAFPIHSSRKMEKQMRAQRSYESNAGG